MANYQSLKTYLKKSPQKADRIAGRLSDLRAKLDLGIKKNRTPGSLIIGSWNIRAFDDGRPRRDESFHYIAEIIDHFDICAIQEVKQDLKPLKRLIKLLGRNWSYFVSDVTEGSRGNYERMAFLYNKNRVFFRNLIGELVLPKDGLVEGEQIARTPFFASFQASWFRFTLCNTHITFGGNTRKAKALRAKEIGTIARALSKRAKKEDEVYIFMGDMNIEGPDDNIMAALRDNGFTAPLFGPTNLIGDKHFDQIAFSGEAFKTNLIRSGSFDWRGAVFKPEDKDYYKDIAAKARGKPYKNWKSKYRDWTTREMSDHLPIWIELKIDYSNDYLARFRTNQD